MSLLRAHSLLWTLPLALVLVSWVGAKLGARATFMLLPPLSVMILHAGYYVTEDLAAATHLAALSMQSVPTVFAWAIPYFHLCQWLHGRLSSRAEEATVACIGATVAAFLVKAAYEPWWTTLTLHPGAQFAGVVGVLLLAGMLMRLRADEREPVSVVSSPTVLFARIAVVVAILVGLFSIEWLPASVAMFVLLIHGTIPRITCEMAVSTHATNGVTASRQVLAGLPVGIGSAVLWCTALMQLPSQVPESAVLPVACVLSLTWSAILTLIYLRIFGVYRAENGLFDVSTDRPSASPAQLVPDR